MEDYLEIAGKKFSSRLILGTGRHRNNEEMVQSIEASGTEMVTVAIRRLDLDDPNKKTILDYIDWNKYQILPNTAGCRTVEEAVFIAQPRPAGQRLELGQAGGNSRRQVPSPRPGGHAGGGPSSSSQDGFVVLPYIHADPVLAKRLEDVGCATVMPLGSAIGSGQGIHTAEEVKIIIEQAHVPVVVDAGLGVPSDASQALEMGASAVLVNTAIAQAEDPSLMAEAFKRGVEAGRMAYRAKRIPVREYAVASSPTQDVPQPMAASPTSGS